MSASSSMTRIRATTAKHASSRPGPRRAGRNPGFPPRFAVPKPVFPVAGSGSRRPAPPGPGRSRLLHSGFTKFAGCWAAVFRSFNGNPRPAPHNLPANGPRTFPVARRCRPRFPDPRAPRVRPAGGPPFPSPPRPPAQVVGVVRDAFNAMTLPAGPDHRRFHRPHLLQPARRRLLAGRPRRPPATAGRLLRLPRSGDLPVEVPAGGTVRLDVVLRMERFTEEVVVTGEAMDPEPLPPPRRNWSSVGRRPRSPTTWPPRK